MDYGFYMFLTKPTAVKKHIDVLATQIPNEMYFEKSRHMTSYISIRSTVYSVEIILKDCLFAISVTDPRDLSCFQAFYYLCLCYERKYKLL